jgi:hypothetical protein
MNRRRRIRERTTRYDRTVPQAQQASAARRQSYAASGRPGVYVPAHRWRGLAARGGWHWVSGGLLVLVAALLTFLLTAEMFYVRQIEVGGLRSVPPEEIFALSGVANYHIFWIDPETVASNVERSSSIASATVTVRWPARVIIRVKEREPALVWQQADHRYWVDVRGNLMLQRMDLPNLVTVLSEDQSVPLDCPQAGCPEGQGIAIDQAVVEGALQLKTLRPEIEFLYYNPVNGLSFDDPRGWRAYFGVGTGTQQRLLLYEAMVSDIQARGLQPEYINVGNLDAPYYRAR